MGVEDPNIIPNAKMTASSTYLSYYPYNGRLNGNTGWCQETSSITSTDYLQVDMGVPRSICAVATQGKKNGSFVTSYKLKLSTDGAHWTTYKENNVDKVCRTQYYEDLISFVEGNRGNFVPRTFPFSKGSTCERG